MSLTYGGQQPKSIKYNNAEVKSIIYGGKTVWTSAAQVTINSSNTNNKDFTTINVPAGKTRITGANVSLTGGQLPYSVSGTISVMRYDNLYGIARAADSDAAVVLYYLPYGHGGDEANKRGCLCFSDAPNGITLTFE